MSHFASVSGAGGSFSVPLAAENQTATMTWAVRWAYINGLADSDAQHGVRTGVPWPGPYTIKAACSPATAGSRSFSPAGPRQSGGGGERSSRRAAEHPRPLAEDVLRMCEGRREARPPTRAASSCPIMYSLGCVLYELLTGEPPFRAGGQRAIMCQHMNKPPDAPRP